MNVFVLYRYWDTPDNEGNEVCGVYKDVDNAISVMKKDAEHVKSYNPYEPATVYCWTITKAEVQ